MILEGVADGRDGAGGGVLDQGARAVDVERVAAGAGGGAEVDGAAVDLDGRLGIAGRFLDRAVADDQAAAVDDDRRRIRRRLGRHVLKDDRARVEDDRGRVPGDDRAVSKGDGPAIDDEVARRGAPLDGDIPPVDRPIDGCDAGVDHHGPAADRRALDRGIAAGGRQVDLHPARGGDRRSRGRRRPGQVERDRLGAGRIAGW